MRAQRALQWLASLWRLPFIYGAIAHAISITSPLSSSVLSPLSTHRIFSPPLHLSARDEPSEGKRECKEWEEGAWPRVVRLNRGEGGGGEQLNIEQLWRSDVMVWQRGGELLESPGRILECGHRRRQNHRG